MDGIACKSENFTIRLLFCLQVVCSWLFTVFRGPLYIQNHVRSLHHAKMYLNALLHNKLLGTGSGIACMLWAGMGDAISAAFKAWKLEMMFSSVKQLHYSVWECGPLKGSLLTWCVLAGSHLSFRFSIGMKQKVILCAWPQGEEWPPVAMPL